MDNTTKRSIFNGTPRPITPTVKNTARPTKVSPTKPAPSQTSNYRRVTPSSSSPSPVLSSKVSPLPIASEPSQDPSCSRISNSLKKPTVKSISKTSKKLWLFILIGVAICVFIGITIALVIHNTDSTKENSKQNSEILNPPIEENTEEINAITKETIDKYAEVTIEGYKEVDDNSLSGKAVVVKVQNKSEEIVSLAIDIGAYDNDDNVMETSSLYAEGMEPGQIYSFNTFVYTELSEEQLRTAKFKVYRASTYNAEGIETEIQSTDETGPVEETQPAEANSTED